MRQISAASLVLTVALAFSINVVAKKQASYAQERSPSNVRRLSDLPVERAPLPPPPTLRPPMPTVSRGTPKATQELSELAPVSQFYPLQVADQSRVTRIPPVEADTVDVDLAKQFYELADTKILDESLPTPTQRLTIRRPTAVPPLHESEGTITHLIDIEESVEQALNSPSDSILDVEANELDAAIEESDPLDLPDQDPIAAEEQLPLPSPEPSQFENESNDVNRFEKDEFGSDLDAVDEKDDADEADDENDEDADNSLDISYPVELEQAPRLTPLSIWEARQAALANNKDIRVIAFEPSEAAQEVDIESAAFDTVVNVDVNGGKLDRQVSSALQAQGVNIDALQTDFFEAEQNDIGGLYMQKQLKTGGTVQWGYDADYNFFSPSGNFVTVNPAWFSRTTLRIEQPLFKGRGPEIALAPIETAQAEQQISAGEFNTLVHETMRDLEVAYWEAALAGRSYRLLQEGARKAFETLYREEELLEGGRGSRPDSLQAEEQYRTIRSELAEAKAVWGSASRELYRLLGTSPSMQQGLIWATETPPVESLLVDPSFAQEAVHNHPEYEGQMAAVRAAEVEVRTTANALQPDLAVRFVYAFTGLADSLDDAIDIMVDQRYNEWAAGVVFRQALGRRAELAAVRKAHLALSREYSALDQIEHDLLYIFQDGYELAKAKIELHEEQVRRRQKSEALVEAQQELYDAGRTDIDLLLTAERSLLNARLAETKSLAEAWTAASEFRYALGQTTTK